MSKYTGRADSQNSKHGRKVKVLVVSISLRPYELLPIRLLCPQDFSGKSTGVGCHFLRQRIFPTQGSNPGLTHCRQTVYGLSHQGSPFIKDRSTQARLLPEAASGPHPFSSMSRRHSPRTRLPGPTSFNNLPSEPETPKEQF